MNDDYPQAFQFAPTSGGDSTGGNDPQTANFQGDPYSLARESIQNIIDVQSGQDKPAIAEFTLMERKASEIPGLSSLKDILESCMKSRKNEDLIKRYKLALFKIKQDHFIKILKIGDYNTVGLTGQENPDIEDDPEERYYSLMKEVGSSSKGGVEGGSFGLGKGAYFASSSFRTIYVRSIYDNDKHVFQGKARLSSFKQNGTKMQGNGTFGKIGQEAIRDKNLIPGFFEREDQGTDIYIIGFESTLTDNWETEMRRSILNFFWYSILRNKLTVIIQGDEINKENLEESLRKYFDEDKSDKEKSPNPWPYYRALTNPDHIEIPAVLETLGEVKLFLIQGENYPCKIAFIRQNGMVIQKKGSQSMSKYSGVFLCENEEGNRILRKMENAKHDQWDSDNARESDLYEKARKAEKELYKFYSSEVTKNLIIQTSDSTTIGGLEEFVFLEGDEDRDDKSEGTIGEPLDNSTNRETASELGVVMELEPKVIPFNRDSKVVTDQITTGIIDGPNPLLKGRGKKSLKKRGGNPNEEGDLLMKVIDDAKTRTYASLENGSIEHMVIVNTEPFKRVSIKLEAGTDDNSLESVGIREALDGSGNNYRTYENYVYGISADSGGTAKVRVKFNSKERYALRVTPYEI